MSKAATLSPPMKRTLRWLADRGSYTTGACCPNGSGANAGSLKALCRRGFLERRDDEDSISGQCYYPTAAGLEALG